MEITTKHYIDLGHLDLGNNFTDQHLFQALADHDEAEKILDFLGECELSCVVVLKANLNFGYSLHTTYCPSELWDCVNAKIK